MKITQPERKMELVGRGGVVKKSKNIKLLQSRDSYDDLMMALFLETSCFVPLLMCKTW